MSVNETGFEQMVGTYPDPELLTMVYEFDKYSPEFRQAVQQELFQRGILPPDVEMRRQYAIEREDDILSEGKPANFPQHFFGWIGIFGILGIIIGYNLYFGKKTAVLTGKQYPRYDEESRESGRYMFYTSLITHAVFVLYKFGHFLS